MKTICRISCILSLMFFAANAFAWDCPKGEHLVQTDGGKFTVAGKHFSCEKDGGTENNNINKNKNQNTNNNTNSSDATVSNETTNNVAAPDIPVSTAYAPTALPTVPCFKGYSGGAQTSAFGISLGGGKVDKNCQILETARSFALHGSDLAYCKAMVLTDTAKQAHITVQDCMETHPEFASASQTLQPQLQPQIIVPAPEVTINVPPAQTIQLPPAQPPVEQPLPAKPIASHHKHKQPNCPVQEK